MRMLGTLAPVAPANVDLEAAGRAFRADMMAQGRLELRRWYYAPAITVHRIVGDGVTVEFADLIEEFSAV